MQVIRDLDAGRTRDFLVAVFEFKNDAVASDVAAILKLVYGEKIVQSILFTLAQL